MTKPLPSATNLRAAPVLHVGDMRVRLLDGGRLKLDGGAMFGIIPKPLWARLAPADERNRIDIGCTCLLIETAGRRILVDTGVGNKYGDKDRDIFAISNHWLLDSLRAEQVEPESIDTVILTHLHFDHAGGATTWAGHDAGSQTGAAALQALSDDRRDAGPTKAVPTFPRATYVVQRGEWDDGATGHFVMTATYRKENLEPLAASGRLKLIDGDGEIAPGVSVRVLPGHTRYQQGIVLRDRDQIAVQPADLMPTAAHVGLRYNMAYDLLPYENMVNKGRLLSEGAAGGWMFLLAQDPLHTAHRVKSEGPERYSIARV